MRRVFVRFLEEIEDTKKTFQNYLTFRNNIDDVISAFDMNTNGNLKCIPQSQCRNIQILEYPVTSYSTSHIKVVLDPDDLRWETFLNQADIPSPAIFLNRQLPSNGNEYVAKKFVPSF